MILTFEQRNSCTDYEYNSDICLHEILNGQRFKKTLKGKRKSELLCFDISAIKEDVTDASNEKFKYNVETSYFVGVDWIVENVLPIYVQPKLNANNKQLDYLKILFEALETPENIEHLDGLFEVYFEKPHIKIKQDLDLLSPLLIVQFIQITHRIVKKGLRKTYYQTERNLESKIKGKVLVNRTIKENILKNRPTKTYCQFDEFGINNDANKILKKALLFSFRLLDKYPNIKTDNIKNSFHYVLPAFEAVSDVVDTDKIRYFKPNPLYREYGQALKLAQLILKRHSYHIDSGSSQEIETPPFWIDMSKLFELYVFKKLRDLFPAKKEVQYHVKSEYQEIDYLIDSYDSNFESSIKIVVDAKYKPRYDEGKISKEDVRQVCGYARMTNIYNTLKVDKNTNIDCLIIYPDQECTDELSKEELKNSPDDRYVNFYKVGIRLPEK